MGNKIICIGREFGSGGHEIGVRLSETLGIHAYERDILHLAARYGELRVETLEAADEQASNPMLFQTVHEGNRHVLRGLPTSEVLFDLQCHEIRRIAASENAIFIGRCADSVLKDEDVRLLRVFITAPFDYRVQRKMLLENLPRGKAKHLVKLMDKQRRRYYEHYTKQRWGDAKNYDLVIDSSVTPLEEAVGLLARRYEEL
jgi:cytidylate kinase